MKSFVIFLNSLALTSILFLILYFMAVQDREIWTGVAILLSIGCVPALNLYVLASDVPFKESLIVLFLERKRMEQKRRIADLQKP